MSAVRNRGKFYTLLALFFLFIYFFFLWCSFAFLTRMIYFKYTQKLCTPFLFLIIQDRRPENRVEDTGSISQQHDNEFLFKAVLVGHIW